jgi:hypothetical protein
MTTPSSAAALLSAHPLDDGRKNETFEPQSSQSAQSIWGEERMASLKPQRSQRSQRPQRFIPAEVWPTVLKGKNLTMIQRVSPVQLHHFARTEGFHPVAVVNASAAAGLSGNHLHD